MRQDKIKIKKETRISMQYFIYAATDDLAEKHCQINHV